MQSSEVQKAKEPPGSMRTILVPMQNVAWGTGTGLETKEESDSNKFSPSSFILHKFHDHGACSDIAFFFFFLLSFLKQRLRAHVRIHSTNTDVMDTSFLE